MNASRFPHRFIILKSQNNETCWEYAHSSGFELDNVSVPY